MRFLESVIVAAVGILFLGAARAEERKPNVVFILADDLGWSDTTLYGTTKFYETPNIARLAARGMKFSNAYAANPVCSPTRASIMTGLYPGRIGITQPSGHVPEERLEASLIARTGPSQKSLMTQSATRLKLEYFTLAEALKEAGYATGHFGKWHLGPEPFDPLHQGFDVDIPHWSGPGPSNYIAPWKSAKFNLPAKPGDDVEDLMAAEAVKFIHAHKDHPFFLNYWAFSVHSPWGGKPELIEKYRRKADPKSPQHNAVYGSMVQTLDDAVGRLIDTLDELKLSDHTIIVFFSDNGGVNWFEPKMKEQAELECAPTSNAPLREGKGTLYEGGTREPCVVVWPGKTKPGSQNDALLSSVDFYPTLLEMTGLQPKAGLKFDGVSQTPALLGTGKPRDTAFCYYPVYSPPGHPVKTVPGVWVRRGDWKLIRLFHDADDQSDRFELYNLHDDIGETTNLAAKFPDRVKELNALITQHLDETHAIVPGKNPAYNPLVPDWTPSRDTTVTVKDGALLMHSTGTNPSISVRDLPTGKGPYTVEFRMKSTSKGNGRLFWAANPRQPYFRDRAVSFEPKHDGEWHDYTVKLPVETGFEMFRMDPAAGPGDIQIEFIRLREADGKVIKEWQYAEVKPKPNPASVSSAAVCNRVRFFPAPHGEQAMVGGRFEGSNVSRHEGYQLLAEIKTAPPAGQWSELKFDNDKVYRWLRYIGPPGSHCKIAELEFYAGDRKISGKGSAFGTPIRNAGTSWQQAFDGNTKSWVESSEPDGDYVGVDLREFATAKYPQFFPPLPGPPMPSAAPTLAEFDHPLDVVLKCATPDAVIRYTLDGTWPTEQNGLVYSAPIHVAKTTTIEAVTFLEGRAPSPPIACTYLMQGDTKPGLSTFHWGNSLTQTTGMLSPFIRTAGYAHQSAIFARPGAWTKELWDIGLTKEKGRAMGLWNTLDHIDHLTVQPRDFDIPEEAGYDIKFFNMAREKSPQVQPWFYCEWTEMKRERPTDKGQMPSSEMKKLFPALTWEESMGAMLLYMEELQRKVCETYKDGKRPRVLPSALAMGWVRNMIDHGKFPGVKPGSFYHLLFNDQVHPTSSPMVAENGNGGYIVDLTWFSAFYRQSPEGKVLPIETSYTLEQSALLQHLAWDMIKNYPDCGLYEEGKEPCGKPVFSSEADGKTIILHSSTPGAWFRYTLDGTTPTRTNGYVYCGVISNQPGIMVKAVAYKSGMADSPVAERPNDETK